MEEAALLAGEGLRMRATMASSRSTSASSCFGVLRAAGTGCRCASCLALATAVPAWFAVEGLWCAAAFGAGAGLMGAAALAGGASASSANGVDDGAEAEEAAASLGSAVTAGAGATVSTVAPAADAEAAMATCVAATGEEAATVTAFSAECAAGAASRLEPTSGVPVHSTAPVATTDSAMPPAAHKGQRERLAREGFTTPVSSSTDRMRVSSPKSLSLFGAVLNSDGRAVLAVRDGVCERATSFSSGFGVGADCRDAQPLANHLFAALCNTKLPNAAWGVAR